MIPHVYGQVISNTNATVISMGKEQRALSASELTAITEQRRPLPGRSLCSSRAALVATTA